MPFSKSNQSRFRRIADVAGELGLTADQFEPCSWYSAKFATDLLQQLADRPQGKLIGVTAINPTPFGEGKTVTSIALAMAMQKIGHRTIVNLRQPSLAPVFGIKGGGAGGGCSRLVPTNDINLHFTGDLHAITAANNLLSAMLDNHIKRKLIPIILPSHILWRRVIDMNDKGLEAIRIGLDAKAQSPLYDTGFDLTAASEVMSILSLATDFVDLRQRLGRIVVAKSVEGRYVSAEELGSAGAMAALIRNAFRPNLVQTCEGTPAIVHAGPFANISHGNNSVLADLTAVRLSDYVITESGFGADNGGTKLLDLKCRISKLVPAAMVIVCTCRALKYHSGKFDVRPGRKLPEALVSEDLNALELGSENLAAHLAILKRFGVPAVVAINRFPQDSEAELELACKLAIQFGARHVARVDGYSQGSEGAIELARAVVSATEENNSYSPLYDLSEPYQQKLQRIAVELLGASGVELSTQALNDLCDFESMGYGSLPVCIAKTQYSLSHDPKLLGRPRDFRVPIRQVRLAAGAGFVLALTEGISLLPSLPREPAAKHIDITPDGTISGMEQ